MGINKEYTKVVEILNLKQKNVTRYNALMKVGLTSTDQRLKQLINDYVATMSRASVDRERYDNLLHYAQDQAQFIPLAEGVEPEWMVQARRHGWTPPRNREE